MELRPLLGQESDHDPIVDRAKRTRYALIGEASHGTHDFYAERAAITRRLIAEAGYDAVAIEGDWPDAYRVNRYVHGEGDDRSAEQALSSFRRFPAWMWRNTTVVEFVEWLRRWNDALPLDERKVGFYGLDLYSIFTSMNAVIEYLDGVDPGAAERARTRYSCFEHFGPEPQVYAYEAGIAGAEPCEGDVIAVLEDLRRGGIVDDDRFYALQNAQLVLDAERYYRAMFRGGPHAWNLRDRHMADTLDALVDYLEHTRGSTKAIVWAHNSHVGDALATQLGDAGELNVGQLARQRHVGETVLVGFTTYGGTVTAASSWGGPAERKRVRPALFGSWEEQFHEWHAARFTFKPDDLHTRRLERAIGVIYRPETERASHYFEATLGEQFDFVVHLDQTHAVDPLERTSEWIAGELPETYPYAV